MIAATPEYLAALRHSHRSHVQVTYKCLQDGEILGTLPPISLQMSNDGTTDVRRQATIALPLDPLSTVSRAISDHIATCMADEVVIEHGIAWGGQAIDWVQLARLRMDTVNEAVPSASREVVAYDRSILIQEHKLPTARPVKGTYVNLITNLIRETLPAEPITVDPLIDTALTPAKGNAFALADDRLRRVQELADALDAWLVCDTDGAFMLDVFPEDTAPVWDIDATIDGVLVEANQSYTRREQYNAVGIEFTPTASANFQRAYIYVWDNDPTSVTYYDGVFGKRNIFFNEEYNHLPSVTEARRVARRKMKEYLGQTRSLELTSVYNPLIEPGDRIRVLLPGGAYETHIVDRVDLSFPGATMSIATRIQRTIGSWGELP